MDRDCIKAYNIWSKNRDYIGVPFLGLVYVINSYDDWKDHFTGLLNNDFMYVYQVPLVLQNLPHHKMSVAKRCR